MPLRALALALVLTACGSAPPPTPAAEPVAMERACFTGSADNGVCEIFSAATEPLSALATHCREARGAWVTECPREGRVGTCAGEGRRAVYYGASIGDAELRRACEAEGHVFGP